MKFKAEIVIMPHKELLDPQGKAVKSSFSNLHLEGVEDVRIGKHVHIEVTAKKRSDAEAIIQTACEKLLANPIIEYFEYELTEI